MSSMKEVYESFSPATRNGFALGLFAVLLVTLGAFYWLLSENYAVLFKDLEPQDAAAIVSELETKEIDYKLRDGGRTVLISEENIHRVRLQLMNSDARLTGGIGFELFDDSDFGMTEFVQKINYQRALQGELTRTITSLDEIKYARVHLVLPENSLFRKDEKTASASVTLFVKDGTKITEKQVSGIQRLIASSVPGMELSSVIVSNQNGVVLSAEVSDEDGSASVSHRLRMRKEVETYLTNKAMKILEGTFGINQALVSIDVALNLDKVQSTLENVIPSKEDKKGVVKKRETKNKSDKKSDSVTTEVEYRLGRKVDQVITMPGSIDHLTVGVLVPKDTTTERIFQIEELIAMAVGLDKRRGDEIVVHAVALPSDSTSALVETDLPNRKNVYKRYIDQSLIDEAFGKSRKLDEAGDNGNSMDDRKRTSSNEIAESIDDTPGISDIFFALFSGERLSVSMEQLKHIIFEKNKELVFAGAILLLLLIGVLLKLLFFRSKDSLSASEREEILKQLEIWLNADNNKVLNEVKS